MNTSPKAPSILLETLKRDRHNHRTLYFCDPVAVISCNTQTRVVACLDQIDRWVKNGFYAAGYISYEAGYALEAAAGKAGSLSSMPLLWFGIFDKPRPFTPPSSRQKYTITTLRPSLSRKRYIAALKTVKKHISRGDTYQIDYTFMHRFMFSGADYALYRKLCRRQRVAYAAFLRTGRHSVISLSPELFFRKKGKSIMMQPMKGTICRGRYNVEDTHYANQLQACPKNRSENLMIVDLLRNDLGRVARPGSVAVRDLFAVQRYETLHQMISTVTARVSAKVSLLELCRSLFPSGSVTGAPKIRAMQVIGALENRPRGIYTGAIGYCAPNGEMTFSVAIRTLVIDRRSGRGELGVGSGVVHDSDPAKEYDECLLKGHFLTHPGASAFRIVETLLWRPGRGYWLYRLHLNRLTESAAYFGFIFDPGKARFALSRAARSFIGPGRRRVRLCLSRTGDITVASAKIERGHDAGTIRFAAGRIDENNIFLFHKTTQRDHYAEVLAAARAEGCFDVLFINRKGEVTEGARSNIVVRIAGRLFTPPVSSGLLNGVLRRYLIKTGTIAERTLFPSDVRAAEEIYMINSVRGMVRVRLQRSRSSVRAPNPS